MTTKNTPAVHTVGGSHSKFGKYDLLEPETLIADAVAGALLDAWLTAEAVEVVDRDTPEARHAEYSDSSDSKPLISSGLPNGS